MTPDIDVEEAVYFLMTAARFEKDGPELKIVWIKENNEVGNGKFKNDAGSVTVKIDSREQVFKGQDANRLRKLGVLQTAN